MENEIYQDFTTSALTVLELASDESEKLGHSFVGTEQILLGLMRCPDGIAAVALKAIPVSDEAARKEIERIVGRGTTAGNEMSLTPRAKELLQGAKEHARNLGDPKVDTEHLLLSLISISDEGVGGSVLRKLGVDLTALRNELLSIRNRTRL